MSDPNRWFQAGNKRSDCRCYKIKKSNNRSVTFEKYFSQLTAVIESLGPDGGDTIRDGEAAQAGAVTECKFPNAHDTIWNGHPGKFRAEIERTIADCDDSCWNLVVSFLCVRA